MDSAKAGNIDCQSWKAVEHGLEVRHGPHPSRERDDLDRFLAVLPREEVTSYTAEHIVILPQAEARDGRVFRQCSSNVLPDLGPRLSTGSQIRGAEERPTPREWRSWSGGLALAVSCIGWTSERENRVRPSAVDMAHDRSPFHASHNLNDARTRHRSRLPPA